MTHRLIAVSQFRGNFHPATKLNILIRPWFEPMSILNKFKQWFSTKFNPTQPLIRTHLFPSVIQIFTSLALLTPNVFSHHKDLHGGNCHGGNTGAASRAAAQTAATRALLSNCKHNSLPVSDYSWETFLNLSLQSE